MIFQEPMTSLNPVYSCGEQIIETLVLHETLGRRAARARAIEMLRAGRHSRAPSSAWTSIRTRCRAACGSA